MWFVAATGQVMVIDGTEFGSIIDSETYPHDVLIQLAGEIRNRRIKLSKRIYRPLHIMFLEDN